MVETINRLIRTLQTACAGAWTRTNGGRNCGENGYSPVEGARNRQDFPGSGIGETPIGEEEDSHLGDFIQDEHVAVPRRPGHVYTAA